ncbi:MAG: hypothetical protein JWN86_4673 [Planctomycetota bacterium]|nr:hypothetical protein [Planctomycetota bacterium]
MNRPQERSDKTIPTTEANPRQDSGTDDRWLADLPNDLGAFSLSSDEIPAFRPEDMGNVFDPRGRAPAKPRHRDVGI